MTELHESLRIDWQLIGRGSRQGDPGSFRYFLAAQSRAERRYMMDRLIARKVETDRQKGLHEAGIDPYLSTVDEYSS